MTRNIWNMTRQKIWDHIPEHILHPCTGFQFSLIFQWKPIFQIALVSISMGETYFQEFGTIFMCEKYFNESPMEMDINFHGNNTLVSALWLAPKVMQASKNYFKIIEGR